MKARGLVVGVLAVAAAACSSSGGSDAEVTVRVVATVSPITNLVANIAAGTSVEVQGLVPEGVNSHTFEPQPSDARLLAQADLFIANGLNLEVPSIRLARANLKSGAEIVELAPQTITEQEWIFDVSFPRDQGDPNPHLWTNPKYAKRYAGLIKDVLTRRDPTNAARYQANYQTLAGRYDALDAAARTASQTVPAQNRKLLTYHDSFPYFAREYGWTVIGAIQPSDFSEPTAREVVGLITQIKAERLPAIFGSEVFPSPVLQQIARETGARYVDNLRDDDLPGESGDPEHSLLGLLVFDFKTFMGALGGDPSALNTVDTSNLT